MSQRDTELPLHYCSVFFERSQHILVVLDDDFVLDLCVPERCLAPRIADRAISAQPLLEPPDQRPEAGVGEPERACGSRVQPRGMCRRPSCLHRAEPRRGLLLYQGQLSAASKAGPSKLPPTAMSVPPLFPRVFPK